MRWRRPTDPMVRGVPDLLFNRSGDRDEKPGVRSRPLLNLDPRDGRILPRATGIAVSRGPEGHREPVRTAGDRRLRDPVDARRQPRQMAPGAHKLVLLDVR